MILHMTETFNQEKLILLVLFSLSSFRPLSYSGLCIKPLQNLSLCHLDIHICLESFILSQLLSFSWEHTACYTAVYYLQKKSEDKKRHLRT